MPPLENGRRVDVKSNHAAVTWAQGVRRLVDEDFPATERVTVVIARRLLEKLQFVYTRRLVGHGSMRA